MTAIDATQHLASLLRTQAAAGRAPMDAAARKAPAQQPARVPRDATAVAAQRIRAIAPDDPQRRQKAVRVFLESVFLRELGQAVLLDPDFSQMVDAVQQRMQEDAELAAAVQAAGDVLLAACRPAGPATGQKPG